jgi:uncharacterized tellurite resistance protein B-like protein
MELTKEQRRGLLAMCCMVARSDGQISTPEYEALVDILARLAGGAVGFSELERWLHEGPPEIVVRFPESAIRMFLRESLTLARVDGKLEEIELSTIRDLVARHFEAPNHET